VARVVLVRLGGGSIEKLHAIEYHPRGARRQGASC